MIFVIGIFLMVVGVAVSQEARCLQKTAPLDANRSFHEAVAFENIGLGAFIIGLFLIFLGVYQWVIYPTLQLILLGR